MRRPAGENAQVDVEVGKPDYLLLGATIALLLLGTIMVYSASFVVAHNEFNDDAYFLVRQLHVGGGWRGRPCSSGYRIDYHRWRRFSLPIMLLCLLLLVAVLVPGIGTRSYGAVRWIRLGPLLQVQPSELAKIAIVLYLADWLARREQLVGNLGKGLDPVRDHRRHRWRGWSRCSPTWAR